MPQRTYMGVSTGRGAELCRQVGPQDAEIRRADREPAARNQKAWCAATA